MDEKLIKCYCPRCKQHTNHTILAEHKYSNENEDDYWWVYTYRMVKCCGCEHVSFDIQKDEESNIQYNDFGEQVLYSVHESYPEPEGEHQPINPIWNYPSDVFKIYKETVFAINAKCYTLAAAGFRAIIEAICNDKQVAGKNLEAKINNMQKTGIITKTDRDRFHSVRFLGNDSIHQMKTPEYTALKIVLEIIENILASLYIFEDKLAAVLESPINTLDEFIKLLDIGLSKRTVGEIGILKNCKHSVNPVLPY